MDFGVKDRSFRVTACWRDHLQCMTPVNKREPPAGDHDKLLSAYGQCQFPLLAQSGHFEAESIRTARFSR
jgi:hypothetical protein